MKKIAKELEDFLNSDKGKLAVEEYLKEIEKEKLFLQDQIKRLHEKQLFKTITQKAVEKYSNEDYKKRYTNYNYPPESIYWFLNEYAKVHGRECDWDEWEKYSNDFTATLVYCEGFYFQETIGQGKTINVFTET